MGSYLIYITLLLLTILTLNVSMAEEIGTANITTIATNTSSYPNCPSNAKCELLEANCLKELDSCNQTCIYGEPSNFTVQVLDEVPCQGQRNHTRTISCRFCYQLPEEDYVCSVNTECSSVGTYSKRVYNALCRVKPDVLCLGKRKFSKRKLCYWSNGYSWSTTMLLSITVGGFGADRFYLGHWREGIGKLFSFGGLGVWTLIDVILVSIGYINPADGSVYTFRSNYTLEDYAATNKYIFD